MRHEDPGPHSARAGRRDHNDGDMTTQIESRPLPLKAAVEAISDRE
jgi:hypothetical protein